MDTLMDVRFSIKDIRLLNLQYSIANEQEPPSESEGGLPGEEQIKIPVDFTCSSNYQNEKRLLRVTLAISIKDPQPGYRLTAEIGGIFRLQADPEKDVLDRLSHVSCPAILFPYLREVVSEVSKRGGFDPLYLPPTNFIRMYETAAKEKGKKQNTEKQKQEKNKKQEKQPKRSP
jgi:preprotein translocase subunit SecB